MKVSQPLYCSTAYFVTFQNHVCFPLAVLSVYTQLDGIPALFSSPPHTGGDTTLLLRLFLTLVWACVRNGSVVCVHFFVNAIMCHFSVWFIVISQGI